MDDVTVEIIKFSRVFPSLVHDLRMTSKQWGKIKKFQADDFTIEYELESKSTIFPSLKI
jgi:hypothetical protein